MSKKKSNETPSKTVTSLPKKEVIAGKATKKSNLNLLFSIIALAVFSVLGYFVGFLNRPPAPLTPRQAVDSLIFKHHHISRPLKLHEPNGLTDFCPLLGECYPHGDSMFRKLDTCHKSLSTLFQYYDSSAMYDPKSGEPVAFISFFADRDSKNNRLIHIYNVCVHPKWRNMGVARRLINEGIEETLAFHNITDKSKVALGLDVDLTSPMPAEAFALYAKMGFMRGWQPCSSVGNIDWRPLFAEPAGDIARSSILELLADPKKYQEDVLKKGVGRAFFPLRNPNYEETAEDRNHFCMFKMYHDSWMRLGELIAEPIPRAPILDPTSASEHSKTDL